MTEDKKLAKEATQRDAENLMRLTHDLGVPVEIASSVDGVPVDKQTAIHLTIGRRDMLSRSEAKHTAGVWKDIVRKFPGAPKTISLLGYDDDPREIWEIPKAARYVRWWAHYAGIHDATDIQAQMGIEKLGTMAMAFLAACGVPIEGVKVELPPKTQAH